MKPLANLLLAAIVATSGSCGQGILSRPLGAHPEVDTSGGAGIVGTDDAGVLTSTGGTAAGGGASEAPPSRPAPLPTSWVPCGILGPGRVLSLAFSPGGGKVAMGHGTGTVRVLSWPNPVASTSVAAHSQAVKTMTFSPSDELLATGAGTDIKLWASEGLVWVRTIPAGMDVQRLLFSPDGTLLLGMDRSTPGTIKIWNTATGTQVVHDLVGVTAAFLANGQSVRTFDGTTSISEVNLSTGKQITWSLLQGDAEEAEFSRDGTMLAGTTGPKRDVALWRAADGTFLWSKTIAPAGTTNAARLFFTDAQLVFVRDDQASTLSADNGSVLVQTQLAAAMDVMGLSRNGDAIAGVLRDGSVAQVSLSSLTVDPSIPTLPGHTHQAFALSRSPDGRYLASTTLYDQTRVFLWDLTTKAAVGTLPATEGFTLGMAFSPDSRFIGVFGDGAYVARVPDGRRALTINPSPNVSPSYAGYQLAFAPQFMGTGALALGTPQGAHIARVTIDTSAQVIDEPNLLEFPSPIGTPGLAFSPDGKRLATTNGMWSTEDNSLLWSIADFTPPASLDAPRNSWVAFSPDGTYVVVSTCPDIVDLCRGFQTKVLKGSNGAMVREINGGHHPVFSANGTAVLAGNTLTDIATGAVTYLPVSSPVSLFIRDQLIVAATDDGSLRMLCPRN